MDNSDKKDTSDIEALLFRPSKVSWGLQKAIVKLDPKFERLSLLTIILSLVGALLWAHFSIKAVVVEATGEVTPIASPIPVLARESLTIRKISVKDNQALNKDDVVLETTRVLPEKEIQTIQKVFQDLQERLTDEKEGRCSLACLAQVKIISDQRLGFLDKVDPNSEFYRDLSDLSRSVKDYHIQLKLMVSLPETLTSLNNELRLTKRRIDEINRRNAQGIMGMELEELRNRLLSIQNQIREKELNVKAMLETSRGSYELALSKIFQSFKQYNATAVIRAPATGRIRFVSIKGLGQTIEAGSGLFMMTQASSGLWMRFQIAEADLSKVKAGQGVRIDLASYPASEFGIQKAKVVEVLDKLPVESDAKSSSFTGYATFNSQNITFKEKTYPLRSGMQGKVKIIVGHESVLKIFIKKIFAIKDEYLGSSGD